jgi:hypothetical protein
VGRDGAHLRVLGDASGVYVLDIDPAHKEARLLRSTGSEKPRLLKKWPLPHDLWRDAAEEPFELAIDPCPEDGPVRELALRWSGHLVGVAVDVSASPSARPAP